MGDFLSSFHSQEKNSYFCTLNNKQKQSISNIYGTIGKVQPRRD